jgi:hypothetical protein
MQELHSGELVHTATLSALTDVRVQSHLQELLSRRTLQEATSGSQTESEETTSVADTVPWDTFFGWFVLVGVAWCIYRGCKPGGWCRRHHVHNQHLAQPQPPHTPVGMQHQLAIGMPAAQLAPGQSWTPAIDPRAGVAVTHVHIGHQYQQQPMLNAAHQPAGSVQRTPRVPTVCATCLTGWKCCSRVAQCIRCSWSLHAKPHLGGLFPLYFIIQPQVLQT